MPKTFRQAFCQRYQCSVRDYERAVFWRCLYRHALPLALLVYWMAPEVFQEDFDLIKEVGQMTNTEIIRGEVNYFYGRNVRDKNVLRRKLLLRVSGKRLLRLKNRVFAERQEGRASAAEGVAA